MTVLERAVRRFAREAFDGFLSGEEIWVGLVAPVEAVDWARMIRTNMGPYLERKNAPMPPASPSPSWSELISMSSSKGSR